MKKPREQEYNPAYQKYIDLVKGDDFFTLLDKNTEETINLFKSIISSKENYKYAQNKWSVKDVLMHIIDTERGFSYRAIVCTRNDNKTPLYGMAEDFYASNVDVSAISINTLIEEFIAVRNAFKLIYTNNKIENFSFLGNAINHNISARAIGYIAIGHVIHHCNVIKEKYLA